MKTKYSRQGDGAFYDYQLLEMLLFYSIPRRDTKPLAKELLETFGSLNALQNANIQQISSVKGVGEETARLIKLTGDIYKRAIDGKGKEITIHGTAEAAKYLEKLLENETAEKFALLLLNNGGKLQFCGIIGDGSPEKADLPIMKITELVTARRATNVVIAHNHLRRVTRPSGADIDQTQVLNNFMNSLGAVLEDHVIVGTNGAYSMRTDPECVNYFKKNEPKQ